MFVLYGKDDKEIVFFFQKNIDTHRGSDDHLFGGLSLRIHVYAAVSYCHEMP